MRLILSAFRRVAQDYPAGFGFGSAYSVGEVVVVVAEQNEVSECVGSTVGAESAVVDVAASVASHVGGESHAVGAAVAVAFDDGFVGVVGHGLPLHWWYASRVTAKKLKGPVKYPLDVWAEVYPGTEFAMWVHTVENLPGGRVRCVLRSGVDLIVPRSVLPDPQKRKRPRRGGTG